MHNLSRRQGHLTGHRSSTSDLPKPCKTDIAQGMKATTPRNCGVGGRQSSRAGPTSAIRRRPAPAWASRARCGRMPRRHHAGSTCSRWSHDLDNDPGNDGVHWPYRALSSPTTSTPNAVLEAVLPSPKTWTASTPSVRRQDGAWTSPRFLPATPMGIMSLAGPRNGIDTSRASTRSSWGAASIVGTPMALSLRRNGAPRQLHRDRVPQPHPRSSAEHTRRADISGRRPSDAHTS